MVRYQLKSTLFYSGSILPQAEVYVYENDCQIEGFIGLNMKILEEKCAWKCKIGQ